MGCVVLLDFIEQTRMYPGMVCPLQLRAVFIRAICSSLLLPPLCLGLAGVGGGGGNLKASKILTERENF